MLGVITTRSSRIVNIYRIIYMIYHTRIDTVHLSSLPRKSKCRLFSLLLLLFRTVYSTAVSYMIRTAVRTVYCICIIHSISTGTGTRCTLLFTGYFLSLLAFSFYSSFFSVPYVYRSFILCVTNHKPPLPPHR